MESMRKNFSLYSHTNIPKILDFLSGFFEVSFVGWENCMVIIV